MLRILGWRVEGKPPSCSKYVLIGGPHTSNWDLAIGLGTMLSNGLPIAWMMKREAFQGPLGPIWRALGGIPVNRQDAAGLPLQMATWFDSVDTGILGITPEGTRKSVKAYKRGYLHIARAADVPVFILGIDAARKAVVFDRFVELSDDMRADNRNIRDYIRSRYNGILPQGE